MLHLAYRGVILLTSMPTGPERRNSEQLQLLIAELEKKQREISEWHKGVRLKFGIDPNIMPNYPGTTMEFIFAPDSRYTKTVRLADNLVFNLAKKEGQDSRVGKVDMLQCSQLTGNIGYPLVITFRYVTGRRFTNLRSFNLQWSRLVRQVTFEQVDFDGRAIVRVIRNGQPGSLFKTPVDDPLHPVSPGYKQQVDIRLHYREGRISGWRAVVGLENSLLEVVFESGKRVRRAKDMLTLPLPLTFDPLYHIQSLLTHNGSLPI